MRTLGNHQTPVAMSHLILALSALTIGTILSIREIVMARTKSPAKRVRHSKRVRWQRWRTYRPEGHPIDYTLKRPWRIAWYLRKYRKKSFCTNADILKHFNRQRELLRSMRSSDRSVETNATKLAVVGDLMWVRTNWSGFLNAEVKSHLEGFDAVLGNLESPVDPRTPPVGWYKIDAAKFNSDPKLLTSFSSKKLGRNIFTAVSFANNHTFDGGDEGALQTLRLLDSLAIGQSGLRSSAKEKGYVLFERNGIRFGMYAVCYGYNNPRYRSSLSLNVLPRLAPWPYDAEDIDLSSLEKTVNAMESDGVEFKILYIHWGHEFELYPTAPQIELGRKLAALGFDLIAGSHSHVLQPSEVVFVNGYERFFPVAAGWRADQAAIVSGRGAPRKTLIHYSLGNFITAMLFWETKIGAIQSVEVFRNPRTGTVDWRSPAVEFVYNVLSIHNHGTKELVLLRRHFEKYRKRIESRYPRNRAAAGYMYRHILSTMTLGDLRRGPQDADYRWMVNDWSRERAFEKGGELRCQS